MQLNEYQDRALETAIYPNLGSNLVYPALKLNGEAGEIAEKVGKLIRDNGYQIGSTNIRNRDLQIQRDNLIKELGDVLWYVAALTTELGSNLQEVAITNLNKLGSRAARGKLQGSGDDR